MGSHHSRPFLSNPVSPGFSFITRFHLKPFDSASPNGGRPLNRTLRFFISGLFQHYCRPDLQREQLSHSRWFPGLLIPRTADHFVFVRPVEFDEQTTSPSRTAQLSGAFPVFPIPNPLSGRLL